MARHRRDDAGNTGTTFYQVTLNPGNWFIWFREPGEKHTLDTRSVDSASDTSVDSVSDTSVDSASDKEHIMILEGAEEHNDAEEDPDFGWTQVR